MEKCGAVGPAFTPDLEKDCNDKSTKKANCQPDDSRNPERIYKLETDSIKRLSDRVANS